MKDMKVLVVGNGFGRNAMAPAYAALGCEVEIISSRDSAAVAAACARGPDLVSIHAPPWQHEEYVLAAIAAGRDVLCDKPFGRNAAEALAMREAARDAGVLHFLNFEFRCQPSWTKAHALIAAGAIGKLTHAGFSSHGSGMRNRPHGWIFESELAGGWIGAYGTHLIDGLRWFFAAEVEDCGGLARAEVQIHPDEHCQPVRSSAEDGFTCWLRFADGGSASIDTSYAAAVALPSSLQLLGSEGAITIVNDTMLTVHRSTTAPEVFDLTPAPGEPAFAAMRLWLDKVLAASRERRQVAPNFDDGLAVAVAIERLHRGAVRAGY
jgi:predicted dehydrogenase